MTNKLTRMWIDQPSTLQAFHALHGTNVLAQQAGDNAMQVYFLEGETLSLQVSKIALKAGWQAGPSGIQEAGPSGNPTEVIEVVTGLHRALSRMIEAHDPDTIEAEWLSHSNELIHKLTGHDV
ncbi:MAG: hypothetical protein Q7S87_01460 [Agitococcus sp.]|nr:hypothetical protein [Agitococcus sp.]